ncbi:three-Cys-motif partner protein [Thiogranum longum]|uniref:Three-Cys-motif partner protein n=1 Tax=Thiogranum longum TaxID=1537524 RepID=A0A4R1HDN7_9GAMM|nr:three-Cys-motif partner protein TcmP [Thiogranum longum]TCK18270.1 three-Cys-motif partner protein [Thiogranum longum]
MRHSFGGPWTRKKLEVLEKYLKFYSTALRNKSFTLHYVDAFAGTGSQDPKEIEFQEQMLPSEDFQGSVRIALDVNPGFHQYHFNDLNPEYITPLKQIREEYPHKTIHITQKDANIFVPEFCNTLSSTDRAVLFLDPYNTELDWRTLQHVTKSQKVDLWLLFPISVIARMTPRDGAKIRPEWEKTLTRLLGTGDWKDALYKPKQKPPTGDLFNSTDPDDATERLNIQELEEWVTKRLKQSFNYVAKPLMLYNNNRPLFLFYFAVSNPNEKAWRLADKVVQDILKKQH